MRRRRFFQACAAAILGTATRIYAGPGKLVMDSLLPPPPKVLSVEALVNSRIEELWMAGEVVSGGVIALNREDMIELAGGSLEEPGFEQVHYYESDFGTLNILPIPGLKEPHVYPRNPVGFQPDTESQLPSR